MIFFNSKNFLFCYGSEVKVIREPAKNDKNWSSNSCDPKNDILWIMSCASTYPTIGERFLMLIILGYPVDDDDWEGDDEGASLEEDGWWELSKHLYMIYIIKDNTDISK